MRSPNHGAALVLASPLLLTPPSTRAEEAGETPGASTRALKLSIGLGLAYAERPRGQPGPDGYGQGADVDGEYVLWPES